MRTPLGQWKGIWLRRSSMSWCRVKQQETFAGKRGMFDLQNTSHVQAVWPWFVHHSAHTWEFNLMNPQSSRAGSRNEPLNNGDVDVRWFNQTCTCTEESASPYCTYRILYVQVEIWYDPSPVPFPPAHPPPKGCVAVDAPGPRMAGQRILKCRHRSTGCFKMCSVPFSKGLCPNIRCAQLWPVSIVSIGNINSPVIHQWFTSDSPVIHQWI